MSLPIRFRLTIWYIALLAGILVAWSTFLMLRLSSDLYIGIDQALASRAAQISLGFSGQGEGEFQDISDSSLSGLPRGESAAQLLSSNGTVLESSGDAVAKHPMISNAALTSVLQGHRVFKTALLEKNERFRILAIRLTGQPGNRSDPRVIVVATSTEDTDNSIHRLLILLFISGPAALAAAGVGGWLLARKALLPVSRITSKAAEIGVSRLNERIEVPTTTDELSKLAVTLNNMLDRLESGVEEKRRFVADASHELRTPLAIMRSEIDVSLDSAELSDEAVETLKSAREEVDRMTRIVENLLTLARIDEGKLQLLRKPVDIKELALTVAQNMRFLADTKDIQIKIEGDHVLADADPEYLGQVMVNLVENAIKYSRPGGLITIRARQSSDDAVLTVDDTGPGIPPDLLSRVFDRFFRVDTARSRSEGGSGLGLSISQEIIKAHGGRIWATSELGKGSSFSIAVPIT